jgi:DeoR/GlpR family transcriptional regulator of sugar metabolism
MIGVERRQQLVELIEQRNAVTVAELSERFGVSAATIRRDLSELSQRGVIERAHGGAARRVRTATEMPEPPLLKRSSLEANEKHRIGRAAASHVHDGETIIISSGTTTAAMVPHLADRADLTVITNALNIALALASYPSITVIVPGGVLRHSELSMLGPLGEEAMENLRADTLFLGSSAIHPDYGLSAENFAEARGDQALMRAARAIVVVADHSKFGRVATVRVAPLTGIRRLITGHEAPPETVSLLSAQGISVELA